MTAESMKAIRIHRHGSPETLVYEDVPKPRPAAGQVLVRNEAAGVNFADIEQRRNNYPFQPPLPHVLGCEFAGTIESVGEGVSALEVGERVFGFLSGAEPAGYAQYIAVSATAAHQLPPGIGYAEGTALLVQGLTAYFLLRDGARLAEGNSVLIMAAAGGLGSIAVQLAKIMAAGKVIGAASTAEKRRLAVELGADETVDYTQPGWSAQVLDATGGKGVDAVLANVGGDSFAQAIASLAPFGRLSAYGGADKALPVVDFAAEFKKGRLDANQTVGFFSLYPYLHGDPVVLRSVLAELVDHVKNGRLVVQLGLQMPLAQAAEAHRLVENRLSTGKVILLPWAD
jgi:NADPH2:quinone reductase